jgi:dienelactone hydrolase
MRYRSVLSSLLALAAPLTFVPTTSAQNTSATAQEVQVERVEFLSRDGTSMIAAYLFRSDAAPARAPAVVMLHGRSGAYSSLSEGVYDATTLSARHKAWGEMLAREGYVALMVDDFGSLGYPQGFGRFTYDDRPAELDEVTQRPLHAYGALRYLHAREDVDGSRVALLGWSNGGSTTLAAMADDKPGDMRAVGFRTGIALYPGCGLKDRFERSGYTPYNPVRVFMGSGDAEVSPTLCQRFVRRSRGRGGKIEITMFAGAEHSYDTPIPSRQSVPANAAAREATLTQVLAWLASSLGN